MAFSGYSVHEIQKKSKSMCYSTFKQSTSENIKDT